MMSLQTLTLSPTRVLLLLTLILMIPIPLLLTMRMTSPGKRRRRLRLVPKPVEILDTIDKRRSARTAGANTRAQQGVGKARRGEGRRSCNIEKIKI